MSRAFDHKTHNSSGLEVNKQRLLLVIFVHLGKHNGVKAGAARQQCVVGSISARASSVAC